MLATSSSKLVLGSVLAGACAIACLAILAQAQYNNFDSDLGSELGKLVRNSGRINGQQSQRLNQQAVAAAAMAEASRNLHNQQQPLQYAPTQHRRNYGALNQAVLNAGSFSPVLGASSGNGRAGSSSSSDSGDDDEGSNFGPGFNNFDNSNANNEDGEGSQANSEGPITNLNQAASGYPAQGEYNEAAGAGPGFNFDGASEFGPSSADGSDFGPSEASFGSDAKRAKSASSPTGARNFGSEEDAGAPQFGPNSAINADGEESVEGRANHGPQAENDDNDDE